MISSLNEMRKKQEEEDKKKAKSTEYFTGGIDQRGGGSGLAVQDPPDDDIFGKIVKRAQEGSDSAGGGASEAGGEDTPNTRITLWANGFQINGGEFRSESDPANRQFLATLAAGFVPEELKRGGANTNVAVGLEDRRTEQFVPPPPPRYVAFGGDAMSLGAVTASELIITPTVMEFASPVIDTTAPSTVIQVKLMDGKKIKVKLNHSSTVTDLVASIIRDGNVSEAFSMSAGFPPKEIRELSSTIAEAGLIGASVMLKAVV